VAIEVSFCIVSIDRREELVRCLDAVARERATVPFDCETIVLDSASRDGSGAAAQAHPAVDVVLEVAERRGKGENASELLRGAHGRYALLLDDDAELAPGAVEALWRALEADARAACAGAALRRPDGAGQPSAWRFPGVGSALAGALFLHRWLTVQSRGARVRRVDWVQSAAMLVRREAAAQVGYYDPAFFVYSDEVDLQKRLADAGWHSLYVPGAVAVHHEQLATGAVPERRIVEFSRNRDLYMRKHHSALTAALVRWLTAWTYALRALAAVVLPGHSSGRYWRHVTATLRPAQGDGVREAAAEYNRAGEKPPVFRA
jgi:GT2 family glycosyltransferase